MNSKLAYFVISSSVSPVESINISLNFKPSKFRVVQVAMASDETDMSAVNPLGLRGSFSNEKIFSLMAQNVGRNVYQSPNLWLPCQNMSIGSNNISLTLIDGFTLDGTTDDVNCFVLIEFVE